MRKIWMENGKLDRKIGKCEKKNMTSDSGTTTEKKLKQENKQTIKQESSSKSHDFKRQ